MSAAPTKQREAIASEITRRSFATRDELTALSSFQCDSCGYGAHRRAVPERCPMCGGSRWSVDRRPSFASDTDLALTRDLIAPMSDPFAMVRALTVAARGAWLDGHKPG